MGKKAAAVHVPGMPPPEPPKPKAPKAPKAAAAPPAEKVAEPAPVKSTAKAPAAAKAKPAAAKASPEAAAAKAPAGYPVEVAAEAKQPKAAAKKAAAKAKSAQAPPAPAPVAAVPAEPKAGAKKKKGKAREPTPPPEPEPEYKKTRRGGGKKKKSQEDDGQIRAAYDHGLAVARKAAEHSADKDEDYKQIKEKLKAAEAPIANGGATHALKKEIEAISDEIDKLITSKKAKTPKSVGPSAMLAMSVEELEGAEGDDADPEMLEDVKKQLEDAKAAEVFAALKTKLLALKSRCETALGSLAGLKAPKREEGKTQDSANMEEQKEAAAMRRLASLHGKEGQTIPASSIFKKTLELEPDVMKYLFTAPFYFNSKFERNYLVIVESNRPPKGLGKGTAAKDLVLIGIGSADVDKCAAALKAFDVSGMQTKEVDFGYSKTKEIESNLNVVVFKQKNSTTVFGTKADVEAAFKMATEKVSASAAALSETLTIANGKVGAMMPLLNGWRILSGATIKVVQPSEDNQDKPAKITISAKTQEELEAAKEKVKTFDANTAIDFLAGDCSKVLQNRSAFKEVCSAHPQVQVDRQATGFQLMGSAAEIKELKKELAELFKKATLDPVVYPLSSEQLRIFNRDNLMKISKDSGADVRRARDNNSALIITGDETSVEQAKAQLAEVIKTEGSTDSINVSDDVIKSLLIGGGAKIREMERQHGVSVNLDKKESKISFMGSTSGVEATKSKIEELQAEIDKEIAETKTQEMVVDPALVRFIIGPKGSVLKKIRDECGVRVDIRDGDDDMSHAVVKGKADDVAKAEAMIQEILNNAEVAPQRKAAPKQFPEPNKPVARKKVAEYNAATADFPTLGGGDSPTTEGSPQKTASAWGGKAAAKTEKQVENSAESFPTLG
eukprot:TRINITY_DN19152_c0_g2_i1.p1 TRINITY_DN19152_c0_g2~~TRINITY_DN19152_c0_g2_i1.p1  ORF type:complete len:899 (-),score=354.38 TRINITY_DN19152_c0_g2_i1:237-2933(-)